MEGEKKPGRKPRPRGAAATGRKQPELTRPAGPRSAAEIRATVSSERSGDGARLGRARTPRPASAVPIEDARPQGPGAEILAERMKELRYLQDFFHNPVPFDLRERPLESSSTPEEIIRRIGEVKYQTEVLQALLVVLKEEMATLNSALPADLRQPPAAAAPPPQTQPGARPA